jgi:hypothetical protein
MCDPTRSIEEHKYVVSLLFGWRFSFFKFKFNKNAPKLEKITKVSNEKIEIKNIN